MRETLALLLQETLAAVARLRRGKSVSDAGVFRTRMIDNLRVAEEQARARKYTGKDVRLAVFAVTAMIDETVLGSSDPVFSEWHKQPLCLQIFNTNLGGEIFFDNARLLLERENTPETADVLEVHLLCLLLGFTGRYQTNNSPEIDALKRKIREKIIRIRGAGTGLPTTWALPAETVAVRRDPLVRRLKIATAAAVAIAVLVFTAA